MKINKLRIRWMVHPCHYWAYTEKYRVASEFNLAHAPLIGRLPWLLRWMPITMGETVCKVCGLTFWTGWDSQDVCNKFECFQERSLKQGQLDTSNTKEDGQCI